MGKLQVAILGTADFDVNDIDQSTVKMYGHAPEARFTKVVDQATPFAGEIQTPPQATDCSSAGSDGFADLEMRFGYANVSQGLQGPEGVNGPLFKGEVHVVTIKGKLMDGRDFIGRDVVRITNNSN
jgi:hypothetical protein